MKQTNELKPYCNGRVLMNEAAANDPIVQAVLADMEARNFEPLPTLHGHWNISDRH